MPTYRILFAGPGLSGRSTTITQLYKRCPPSAQVRIGRVSRGPTWSLEAVLHYGDADATIVLFATPGSIIHAPLYEEAASIADGIVFVIDSQVDRLEACADNIDRNIQWLRQAGRDVGQVPCVIQYNKRDLPRIMTVADLERELNMKQWPHFESIATKGQGVAAPADHLARLLAGRRLTDRASLA